MARVILRLRNKWRRYERDSIPPMIWCRVWLLVHGFVYDIGLFFVLPSMVLSGVLQVCRVPPVPPRTACHRVMTRHYQGRFRYV